MALSKVIDASDMGSSFTVSSKGSYVSIALSTCRGCFAEKHTSWPLDDFGIRLPAKVFTALAIIRLAASAMLDIIELVSRLTSTLLNIDVVVSLKDPCEDGKGTNFRNRKYWQF
jgi:hypothetical protein